MSIKKKVGISDLLRDEVQKETETPANSDSTEQTIEVKAETIAEPVSKASIRPELNAAAKSPSLDDRTKAKVSDLELSLAQSRQRETELSQTVADL
ncbi:MAG: hypothetical protein ACK59W_08165, partial [Pseudanabaena sp.]